MAGVDYEGPQLYQLDPSGVYYEWKAAAVGKNASIAKVFLEKRYKDDFDRDEAIHTALLALKDGFEGTMSNKNIEIAYVDTSDSKFKVLNKREIDNCLGFIKD